MKYKNVSAICDSDRKKQFSFTLGEQIRSDLITECEVQGCLFESVKEEEEELSSDRVKMEMSSCRNLLGSTLKPF